MRQVLIALGGSCHDTRWERCRWRCLVSIMAAWWPVFRAALAAGAVLATLDCAGVETSYEIAGIEIGYGNALTNRSDCRCMLRGQGGIIQPGY